MAVTGMLTSKEECKTCSNKARTNHKSKFYKLIQEMKFCLIKAVSLVFGKSVPVSREMHAYPFLSLLAEVRSSALVNMVSI